MPYCRNFYYYYLLVFAALYFAHPTPPRHCRRSPQRDRLSLRVHLRRAPQLHVDTPERCLRRRVHDGGDSRVSLVDCRCFPSIAYNQTCTHTHTHIDWNCIARVVRASIGHVTAPTTPMPAVGGTIAAGRTRSNIGRTSRSRSAWWPPITMAAMAKTFPFPIGRSFSCKVHELSGTRMSPKTSPGTITMSQSRRPFCITSG